MGADVVAVREGRRGGARSRGAVSIHVHFRAIEGGRRQHWLPRDRGRAEAALESTTLPPSLPPSLARLRPYRRALLCSTVTARGSASWQHRGSSGGRRRGRGGEPTPGRSCRKCNRNCTALRLKLFSTTQP